MATERAMRIVDTSTPGKWGSVKDPASFGSHNMVVDELGLLLKGHKTHEDQTSMVPNRSGSAPPSMEGSYASFGNILYSHKSSWDSALASSGSGFQYYQPEDRLRSDPSNDVMTTSDINLTPKFPQPFMSREGKKQTQYMGGMGSNWKLKTSGGGSSDGSLLLTRSSLSTHHEEPEDDISSQKTSEDLVDNSPSSMSLKDITSLAGQRKNLVDLKQADFSRTPSPAYNETHSSHVATKNEAIVNETETPELNNLSLNVTKSPDPKPSVDSGARVEGSYWLKVQDNSSADLVPKTTYLDKSGDMSSTQKNAADSKGKFPGKDGILGSNDPRSHDENTQENKMYETNSIQQQLHRSYQHSQVQGYQGQATAQSNNMFGDSRNVLQGPPNFSLQSSGLTPPLYASAAAYMTSGNQYYSNPHPPLYAPQYSTGGYPFGSTFVPSLVAGYPPNAGLPIAFDPGSTQSLNSQTIVSPGETNTQVGELPLYNKFYGHQGFVVQPPFPDPLQMPYFHYPSENSFSPQYGRIPPANLIGDQIGPFAPQRDPTMPAYVGDNKFPFPPNASLSIMSPRKVGMPSNNFYGTTAGGAGYVPHYPGSLGSPLMPGSPVGAASPSGRRYDPRFPQGFVRNPGSYAGWQGQRGHDSHIDSKKHSFLEELKANNARKFNLSDIAERIVEFSVDQHGSRFIQQKLENCSAEEKASVFKEVLPHASRLMTDVFGNYVIQKFFEYGDNEQRKELANKLSGQMLPLSLQMYGCRVIQKALEVIELDQKTTLTHELDGHVMRCVRDQNGNHVIQKCIECLPTENIDFIISAFRGQVATLSTHPYGCRVIQRVLEHCSDESQTQCIVDEILESSYILAQDQYGNYVTQHVLERGKPHERNKVISKLQGKIVQMSQHKYASNVVEKCLEYGDAAEREIMVNEILAQPAENDNLLVMMKDQYANYVVQKILEISNNYQHDLLLKRIRGHLDALKKYTYGKHIVARFEQLSGEEEEEEEEEEDSGTSEP